MSEPFSGIFGPVVEESTSNSIVEPRAAVAFLRTGLKSKLSRNSYSLPDVGEIYFAIVS